MSFDVSIPWAIQPEHLIRIDALATAHMTASASGHQAAGPSFSAPGSAAAPVVDGVAVIDLTGPLTKGYSWMTAILGGTSMQIASALIEQAAVNPAVKGILLRIDSPGGSVDGTEGLARAIGAASAEKQVFALASGMIASAAYWAGSAASAVYLESGTTIAGSIGVVSKHVDISALESRIGIKTTEISSGKFKRIASMHEPLSDAGRSSIQEQLDHIYSLFVTAVATHRGVSVQTVLDRMADGRTFVGQQAIDAGLADGFASQSELLERLRDGKKPPLKSFNQSTRSTVMTPREINEAAFAEVGPKGTTEQYKAAISRLSAGNSIPEPRDPVSGLTLEEKVEKGKAYALEHRVDLVSALKSLGFAK